HVAALEARLDCVAAVHTHSPYLTAYAYCNKLVKLKCSTVFALLFEDIPCVPYGEPATAKIASGIAEVLKDRPLILLGNHGVLSVGRSMEEAVALVESAEDALHIHHLATQIGTVRDIPEDAYEHLLTSSYVSVRNRYQ
ncbi:MAG: class II aldolase/adducin family protein, partial [Oscillospiraceae bacterium]|nr:class II aldolase/adducin family protein [Oscillospiraceae bacterium]